LALIALEGLEQVTPFGIWEFPFLLQQFSLNYLTLNGPCHWEKPVPNWSFACVEWQQIIVTIFYKENAKQNPTEPSI
jgi:hypothetical protein